MLRYLAGIALSAPLFTAQSYAAGEMNNQATIEQSGVDYNAEVNQIGENNLAYINQAVVDDSGRIISDMGGGGASVIQNGQWNYSKIKDQGIGNTIAIEQEQIQNQMTANVSGSDNGIRAIQNGMMQQSAINIQGDMNSIQSYQEGVNNSFSATVDGNGNDVSQLQAGQNNASGLQIIGDGNAISQSQSGNGLSYELQFTGNGQAISVSQTN